jgi:hypothetical protein
MAAFGAERLQASSNQGPPHQGISVASTARTPGTHDAGSVYLLFNFLYEEKTMCECCFLRGRLQTRLKQITVIAENSLEILVKLRFHRSKRASLGCCQNLMPRHDIWLLPSGQNIKLTSCDYGEKS